MPTAAALQKLRILCIRKLHEAEQVCAHHQRSLEMSGADPDRRRARSVVRIVRAALAAVVREDDASLEELARAAMQSLRRARIAQERATGTWMLTIPAGTYEHGDAVAFSLSDVVPEKKRSDGRRRHMVILRNTMAMWIGQGDGNDELAEVFMSHAESPFTTLPMLRDEGVWPFRSDALKKVRKALSKIDRGGSCDYQAERVIIQGMKALGMPKDKAESLFDFEKKATKRRGGTWG
jgi:hypothetical protein